jgi:serine/threonine protein kinase
MPLVKERYAEPIPGYRLLERLGSGGFGEVWKAEAPGGLFKAIKFVHGNLDGLEADSRQAEVELQAIEHIKTIRHPFLLSMDRVEIVGGELLIVTELADKNLFDLLQEHRAAGQPGVPRAELLGFLREAAEVLDLLNVQHGLQHLDIKPHNLFLVSGHVKVADFGLVSSLSTGGQIKLGAITPLYASPEVFLGRLSPRSDQYSLAIVYQELLTGTLPFHGKNARQLLLQHTQGKPDLGPLPESDRPVVARALAKAAEDRYPTCRDFVRALLHASTDGSNRSTDARLDALRAEAEKVREQADAETNRSLSVTPPRQRAAASRQRARSASEERSSRPLAAAGYTFVECLGSSPLMDVWRAKAADGRPRLLKLLYGAASGRRLKEALARFRLLQHPALVPCEVVQCDPGRLVLATDPVEEGLRERFGQCQAQGQAGIPRRELLEYLRAAAEALDYLYQQHSVSHLGLNPRQLLLSGGRLVLADFGLAHLFWLPAGQPVAQRNARYAAPELFKGSAGPACDQFSLAVIYHELLTGRHPFPASNKAAPPMLADLPQRDREGIARALDPDPQQRWPSCTELVRALAGEPAAAAPAADRFQQRLRAAAPTSAPTDAACSPLGEIIARLVESAGGTAGPVEGAPTLSPEENLLRHHFSAGLPLGAARSKLDAFRRQCHGQLLHSEEGLYCFHVSTPARLWQQWIGRQPGLEVQVRLARQHPLAATPIEVAVQVRALRCNKARALGLLEEMGASLLQGLRTALLAGADKRVQERLLWPHPIRVRPVQADGTLGEPVACRGKDISLSGIGFYLPHELPTAEVAVELPATPLTPALSVPATLVRAKRCADGWYDVGALFHLVSLRKSLPSLCRT